MNAARDALARSIDGEMQALMARGGDWRECRADSEIMALMAWGVGAAR